VYQIVDGYKENSIQSLFDGDNLTSLIPDSVNAEMFKVYPYAFKKYYPTMFTFQLSDVCNYECIMCGGAFSSSIRKNREQRPAFKALYDDNFVDQLREFIPHLKKIYFVGGEPLMTSINYKIMDLIVELNPNIQIYITTNGSVINTRIKQLIDKLPNLRFIVSIDSLTPTTYSLIRKNGNLDIVMQNLEYLLSIKRLQVLAVCPMIQNVYELPSILEWCNERNVDCWLQVVEFPLGGYIQGIHEFPEKDVPNYYDVSNKYLQSNIKVNLDNKLPLVAFNTLGLAEKIKIKEFLENAVYPLKFKGQVQALINQIMA
jgi:MoaA/NifB/PqqE/SkfB family radical SAM enzyme